MQAFPENRVADMRGMPVYDTDRDKIGSVDDVFLDNDTGKPEWLAVAGGLISTSRVLVPVHGGGFETDAIQVPYAKEHVNRSPTIASDEIGEETERDLYAYYGLDYPEGE